MITREDFVNIARSYIGTPYHHQGRVPGVGIDCGGVVVCAAKECGYIIDDMNDYACTPSHGSFVAAVKSRFIEISIDEIALGDLMIFSFGFEPQHIAIISAVTPLTIVHTYTHVGKVVENHLDLIWRKRLRGCYRLKGIE